MENGKLCQWFAFGWSGGILSRCLSWWWVCYHTVAQRHVVRPKAPCVCLPVPNQFVQWNWLIAAIFCMLEMLSTTEWGHIQWAVALSKWYFINSILLKVCDQQELLVQVGTCWVHTVHRYWLPLFDRGGNYSFELFYLCLKLNRNFENVCLQQPPYSMNKGPACVC